MFAYACNNKKYTYTKIRADLLTYGNKVIQYSIDRQIKRTTLKTKLNLRKT